MNVIRFHVSPDLLSLRCLSFSLLLYRLSKFRCVQSIGVLEILLFPFCLLFNISTYQSKACLHALLQVKLSLCRDRWRGRSYCRVKYFTKLFRLLPCMVFFLSLLVIVSFDLHTDLTNDQT